MVSGPQHIHMYRSKIITLLCDDSSDTFTNIAASTAKLIRYNAIHTRHYTPTSNCLKAVV